MATISEKRKAELVAEYAPRIFAASQEHRKKLEAERLAAEAAKPKPAVVAVVSAKFAEAAKGNPESVRLSARASDNTTVIERPRQSDIVEVLEVDAQGRVAVARTCDAATNSYGVVEFNQGYRAQPGAVSDYNPISALRLKGDEVDG